ERIKQYMLDHNESLAVAESVTSGQLQAALSLAEDATRFYQGGITAYNLGQKTKHLGIDPIHGEAYNCVSEQIAVSMAEQVCSLFSSGWGIGITGYAAPVPELKIKTLHVYYAFAHHGKKTYSKKITAPARQIIKAQQHFTAAVLNDFARYLWASKR
ncbi:MAG TPA: nicotinamide-nucleotide amidohydrolase family protein, partial [Cyclobacteriaceae bacterium]|nr:nicotinamide-nucleotide amidohydrolase family protein [Cyclobacteriaceae bacterium]